MRKYTPQAKIPQADALCCSSIVIGKCGGGGGGLRADRAINDTHAISNPPHSCQSINIVRVLYRQYMLPR